MLRLSRVAPIGILALATLAGAVSAQAAPPAPATQPVDVGPAPKLAVIDPQIVLDSLQEMKEIKDSFKNKQQDEVTEENRQKAAVSALEDSRKQLKPDSKQFTDVSEQIDAANANLQAWEARTRADNERQQKQTLKTLYKEIEDATARIAQQEGLDLVITTIDQEIPSVESMTNEQLHLLLDERVVMYHSPRIDITQKVLLLLDNDYQQRKNAGAPQP